jgi:hypothetical protein
MYDVADPTACAVALFCTATDTSADSHSPDAWIRLVVMVTEPGSVLIV